MGQITLTVGARNHALPFKESRDDASADGLDLWIDLMPDSPYRTMFMVRSVLVQPVKPSKVHRVSPLAAGDIRDRAHADKGSEMEGMRKLEQFAEKPKF